MLSPFNLLPLLKGWEYKVYHTAEPNARRGVYYERISLPQLGWVMHVGGVSTDCYGAVVCRAQGADLQTQELWMFAGERHFGGVTHCQDPAGWVSHYYQPNPNSTMGLFATAITPAWQGFGMPFAPTIKMGVKLLDSSTQDSAYIRGYALLVVITNKKLFIQSLRRLLDSDAKLHIDPELLAIGPAEFEEGKR